MTRTQAVADSVNALLESHEALDRQLRRILILIAREINPTIGTKPTMEEWQTVFADSKVALNNAKGDSDGSEETQSTG